MGINDYDRERLEDEQTQKNMAVLEGIFKQTDEYLFNDENPYTPTEKSDDYSYDSDPMARTGEINKVDLDELKKFSEMLHKEVDEPETQSAPTNESSYGGKQKVLTTKPAKYSSSGGDDVKEIVSSFLSCFILALVTAGIGVSWLLYILMHI